MLGSRAGLTYKIKGLAEAGELPHVLFSYETDASRLNIYFDPEWREQQRKQLLPGLYAAYHENAACESLGQPLFDPRDIDAAVLRFNQPQTQEEWQALIQQAELGQYRHRVGVGLDRASVGPKGDRSVWSVTAGFAVPGGPPFYMVTRETVFPTGSEAEDARTRGIFGDRGLRVMIEKYNADDLRGKVRGASLEAPSAQRQQGLFTRLSLALREGRLALPSDAPGLVDELLAMQVSYGTQLAHFEGRAGLHDDRVYALAWSLEASEPKGFVAPQRERPKGM
jgi:hypothetical protein